MIACCFFFQAEDGIRDLVRSRGLGDVYKRQGQGLEPGANTGNRSIHRGRRLPQDVDDISPADEPVSYTHLTLPTSDLV